MKIGVFDSGVGGQAVVNAIKKAMPDLDIIYAEDRENVPYGTKSPEELHRLVKPILEKLVSEGCRVIVIACNSVTTTIIGRLREEMTTPLIGMEPMIKPAAETTTSKIVAVCATPVTLASERYKWLKETYAPGIKILEPDCSDWAYMIESKSLDHEKIRQRITDVCKQGADTIVLGCTHYHWIEKEVQKIANDYNATVIQPEQAVIRRLESVLEQLA